MNIRRTLATVEYRKSTNTRPDSLADLQLLVGDPQKAHCGKHCPMSHQCGDWLFITISMPPKCEVDSTVKGRKKCKYENLPYDQQLETVLRYFESVYIPYLRGFSYSSWELDKSGKLHLHVLHHSYDKIEDSYVLRTIQHGVRTHALTQGLVKGKIDYMNSIVSCTNPVDTLQYLLKDHDKKNAPGLPRNKYFYWHIV